MGSPATRPQVMAYFSERPDKAIYIHDLAKATKLTEQQARTAVNNVRQSHERKEIDFPIETIQRGQIWMYRPSEARAAGTSAVRSSKAETVAVGPLYEEVGTTRDGDIILSRNGTLYKAQEL